MQELEGGREGGQAPVQEGEGEEEEGIHSRIFSTHGEEGEEQQQERGPEGRRVRVDLRTRFSSRREEHGGEGVRLVVGGGLGACRGWEE